MTGTPTELDREFAGQLVGFTDSFVKLESNLAEIEAAHATAVKAVEAEKKKEMENKRKGSISKASSTTPEAKPGPAVKDRKPVFGTKTGIRETPSLFDSDGTVAPSRESQRERAPSAAGQATEMSQVDATNPGYESNADLQTATARLPGL